MEVWSTNVAAEIDEKMFGSVCLTGRRFAGMTTGEGMANEQRRIQYGALGTLVAAAFLVVLYCFPPGQYGFYPRCGLYLLTGLQCPGCGGLRAAHCLLHGDVSAAFHYNPLLVLLAPAIVTIAGWMTLRRLNGIPLPRWAKRPLWIWLLLGIGLVFSVVRNLPAAHNGSF